MSAVSFAVEPSVSLPAPALRVFEPAERVKAEDLPLAQELRSWGDLRDIVEARRGFEAATGHLAVAVIPGEEIREHGVHTLLRDPVFVTLVVHPARGRGLAAVVASFGTPFVRYNLPYFRGDRWLDLTIRPFSAEAPDAARRNELRDPRKRYYAARAGGDLGRRARDFYAVADFGSSPQEAKLAVRLWAAVTSAAVRRGRYPASLKADFPGYVYGASTDEPRQELEDAHAYAPRAYGRVHVDPAELFDRLTDSGHYVPDYLKRDFFSDFARGLPVRANAYGRLRHVDGGKAVEVFSGQYVSRYATTSRLLEGSPVRPGDLVGFVGPHTCGLGGRSVKHVEQAAVQWAGGPAALHRHMAQWLARQCLLTGAGVYAPVDLLVGTRGVLVQTDVLYDVQAADPGLFDAESGAFVLPPLPYHGEEEAWLGTNVLSLDPCVPAWA